MKKTVKIGFLGCGNVGGGVWRLINGFASAVDALMAVYELVYEDKVTTLEELKDALDRNWEGYEPLRRRALRCRHKFGVGDRMADAYADAIHRFFADHFAG